jgi:hypothetical protein
MNLVGQGSQYVALTVTDFKDALKAVTSWNAEGKWKVMKMKKIKENIKFWLGLIVFILFMSIPSTIENLMGWM